MANLRQYINNFGTTLDGAVLVGDTVITLTDGSDLPVITGSEFYELTFTDVSTGNDIEIVKVTARTGNDITVVRAQGGTLAFAYADLDIVRMNATADSWERLVEGDQSVSTTDSPTFVDATIDSVVISDLIDSSYANLGTGIITGGGISINGGDNTKFDIAAGSAYFVDVHTDPANPVVTKTTWIAKTAVTVTTPGGTALTQIYLDSTATVVQQVALATPTERRDLIYIAAVFHPSGPTTQIFVAANHKHSAVQSDSDMLDLALALGPVNLAGNVFTPNGANLKLDKSAGETYAIGQNYDADKKTPNIMPLVSLVQAGMIFSYQDGSGDFILETSVTDVPIGLYDDGSGVLQTVANNNYTTHRIFSLGTGNLVECMYGQNVYAKLEDAREAIFTESANINPVISQNAAFRSWLIVKGNASDLSNSSQAEFIQAGSLRNSVGGGAAAAGSATLQSAYDSSTDPEILLSTSSTSGISILDNASPISGDLLHIDNSTQSTTFFSVSSSTSTFDVDIDLGTNYMDIGEISTPANPAANVGRLYVKDDASTTTLYFRDNAGVETDLLAGGGGGGDSWSDAVDAIITPDADGTRDIGLTGTRFATVYMDNIDVTTNMVIGGTVDGRDIATDGTKLDGVETAADVTDEANVTTALDGATLTGVTVATGDKVIVQDVSDSDNIKTVTAQSIADLGGGGGLDIDALAIYPTTDVSAFQDRMAIYDNSAGTNYKLGLDNFFSYSIESMGAITSLYTSADLVCVVDISTNTAHKMTGENLMFEATDNSTVGTFVDATNDFIGWGDTSGSDWRKITPLNFAKTCITGATELSTPDYSADFIGFEDVSANAYKKMKLQDIAGRLVSSQIFTSNGTWTKPAGIKLVKVTVIGGGGGSGGCGTTEATESAAAGGGGGGGCAIEIIDVSGTASETITVGAGGVAGAVDAVGAAGGTSSFGAFCSATGGAGGTVGNDSTTWNNFDPVAGGVGSGGDINIDGGQGQSGQRMPSEDSATSGAGGISFMAGAIAMAQTNNTIAAVAGKANGGGAGGGCNANSQTEIVGAVGGVGVIIVEEYS